MLQRLSSRCVADYNCKRKAIPFEYFCSTECPIQIQPDLRLDLSDEKVKEVNAIRLCICSNDRTNKWCAARQVQAMWKARLHAQGWPDARSEDRRERDGGSCSRTMIELFKGRVCVLLSLGDVGNITRRRRFGNRWQMQDATSTSWCLMSTARVSVGDDAQICSSNAFELTMNDLR